jgi:hypothetical protein
LPAVGVALARPNGTTGVDLLVLVLGIAGLVWLAVGLAARWGAALAAGIAFLGAEQALALATGPSSVDPWTPLYAAGLLLAAELAWWSIEPRVPAWANPIIALRRFGIIVLMCALGAALAALVVLAAGAPLEGGVSLELVGVLAAVGAVVVVAVLAHRHAASEAGAGR